MVWKMPDNYIESSYNIQLSMYESQMKYISILKKGQLTYHIRIMKTKTNYK